MARTRNQATPRPPTGKRKKSIEKRRHQFSNSSLNKNRKGRKRRTRFSRERSILTRTIRVDLKDTSPLPLDRVLRRTISQSRVSEGQTPSCVQFANSTPVPNVSTPKILPSHVSVIEIIDETPVKKANNQKSVSVIDLIEDNTDSVDVIDITNSFDCSQLVVEVIDDDNKLADDIEIISPSSKLCTPKKCSSATPKSSVQLETSENEIQIIEQSDFLKPSFLNMRHKTRWGRENLKTLNHYNKDVLASQEVVKEKPDLNTNNKRKKKSRWSNLSVDNLATSRQDNNKTDTTSCKVTNKTNTTSYRATNNTLMSNEKVLNIAATKRKPDVLSTDCLSPQSKLACVGNNIYSDKPLEIPKTGLRPVIIDGCNVAFHHSNNRFFSCKGLEICINYFKKRGHKVTAFVPHFRVQSSQSDNPQLLNRLNQMGDVVFTPSRYIDGHRVTSYDDRYIVQTAAAKGGIIISRDNYRDLLVENPAWGDTIKYRLLQFTWVEDLLIFPKDPLGEKGPTLDQFLRFS